MSESKIKPLADRVVVRPLTDEEAGTVSASGIIIPDTVTGKERSDQGIIVAVGPGKWDEDGAKRLPLEVKEGDKVLFKTWNDKTKFGDQEYWVLSESDILAVIG